MWQSRQKKKNTPVLILLSSSTVSMFAELRNFPFNICFQKESDMVDSPGDLTLNMYLPLGGKR